MRMNDTGWDGVGVMKSEEHEVIKKDQKKGQKDSRARKWFGKKGKKVRGTESSYCDPLRMTHGLTA